jgi:hypothetical protein
VGYFSDNALVMLRKILRNTEKILSGLEALQANVTALTNLVTTLITDVTGALQNDDPDAAVAAANDVVAQAITNLQALDVQVTGTTPPAPPAS